MKYLTNNMPFPDVSDASEEGLLAIGGELSVDRLLEAYKSGIFPWFSAEEPILLWSPDPRYVLFPEKLKVSKSMKQILEEFPESKFGLGGILTIVKDSEEFASINAGWFEALGKLAGGTIELWEEYLLEEREVEDA